MRTHSLKTASLALGVLLSFAAVSGVRADGEVGLVIQDGDAVTTYCVAFSGDSISGDQMLKRTVTPSMRMGRQWPCDLFHRRPRVFRCRLFQFTAFANAGGECTYWSFFTTHHGRGWVYSALAFNLLKAKDGDVHGWKWGKGAPSSAPCQPT